MLKNVPRISFERKVMTHRDLIHSHLYPQICLSIMLAMDTEEMMRI